MLDSAPGFQPTACNVFGSAPRLETLDLIAASASYTVGRRMLARLRKDGSDTPRKADVAARLFVAALIAAVGVAQFSASWHEASVRHVRCAEHGEAIDVGVVSGVASPVRDRAARAGMEGADGAETASHDHCSVVLAFRGSGREQLVRQATRFEPPPVVVRPASEPTKRPGRAFVLASAPKTSPPSA
jgi:hypothetical protein